MSDFDGSSRRESAAAVAQVTKEKAGEGAGLVSEKATETVDTAKEQAADVAGEASATAQDLAGQLRDRLQDQARSQTQHMARNVRRLSDELRDMSESAEDGSSAAGAVKQLADRGQRMATHLERRGPEGLVDDLQQFARRRPGAFLAGAALVGFAAARLGKGIKSAEGDGRRADAPGPLYAPDAADSGDGYGPTRLTPSYGGSVRTPGAAAQSDPYPEPGPGPGPRQS